MDDLVVDLCVQPDNTTLKDYGRLLKDGELKIRAHSDNRTKNRSVSASTWITVWVKSRIMNILREICN